MSEIRTCPHCGETITIRLSIGIDTRNHDQTFAPPNVKTNATHVLARHGLTLADAHTMPDEELLALPLLGKTSLRWIRAQQT